MGIHLIRCSKGTAESVGGRRPPTCFSGWMPFSCGSSQRRWTRGHCHWCHVTSGTVTSGTQSNCQNYPKPNIHITLIATANQKVNPEVTVQEMMGHHCHLHLYIKLFFAATIFDLHPSPPS